MNIAVRYYSRGGNTKRLAGAVAQAADVKAASTGKNLSEKADILFLGSSLYAGGFADEVKTFLSANADKIGTLVCFGSSASGKSTYGKVKAFAEELGITVCDRMFNCPGHFLFMHKNRPNRDDLNDLQTFVREILDAAEAADGEEA